MKTVLHSCAQPPHSRSNVLEHLPSKLTTSAHSSSLLDSILFHEDICDYDAVVLIEQPGVSGPLHDLCVRSDNTCSFTLLIFVLWRQLQISRRVLDQHLHLVNSRIYGEELQPLSQMWQSRSPTVVVPSLSA